MKSNIVKDSLKIALLVFSFFMLLLVARVAIGGINVPFTGSNYPDVDSQTVFQYRGDVSGAGDLYDMSGENLLTYSEAFDSWTLQGTASVITNTERSPIYPFDVTADTITVSSGANGIYQNTPVPTGNLFSPSVYIKRISTSGSLRITHPSGPGSLVIDLATVGNNWIRISSITPSATNVPFYGDSNNGGMYINALAGTISFYAIGPQVVDNTDGIIVGPGIYKSTTSVAKPRLDLTQHGNPTTGFSDLQMSDGNRVMGRVFTGTKYYDRSHHDALNIFDGDFVFTHLSRADSVGVLGTRIMTHLTGGANGIQTGLNSGETTWWFLFNGASNVFAFSPSCSPWDGKYHIHQTVRSGNIATYYLDGVAGTPVDVTGLGVDVSTDVVFGAYPGSANYYLNGQIAFAQLDPRALSATELAAQREKLWGLYSNKSKDIKNWTFTRSTVATKILDSGPTSLSQVAVNVPRVSDGVTVEGSSTQLHGLTEAFDSWVSTDCTKTPNVETAPDGTMTADLLDNTAAVDGRTYNTTASLGALAGRTFTQSVWVKAYSTRHKVTIRTTEIGIGTICTSTPMAETYWTRVSVSCTAAGGGSGAFRYYVLPGDDGVASGQAYFWGHNFTETKFLTSYIQNAGAETSQVTRTADNLSIPLHQASTNKDLLPNLFGPLPNMANTLTVEFEAKTQWTDTPDANRRLVHIGGTSTNRIGLYHESGGKKLWVQIYDGSGGSTEYYVDTTGYNFSNRHKFKAFIDFSDLTRNAVYIDDVNKALVGVHTGTITIDTTGKSLYIGGFASSGYELFGTIKDLRINEIAF